MTIMSKKIKGIDSNGKVKWYNHFFSKMLLALGQLLIALGTMAALMLLLFLIYLVIRWFS
jgi:hypothetical protein